MQSVRPDKAGVGSAVLNSARQVGGSLGIAIMGAIVAASATPGQADPADFLRGFHHALVTAAGLTVLGALVAAFTLGGRPRRETERTAALAEMG
jgi:sugar phosphate permease